MDAVLDWVCARAILCSCVYRRHQVRVWLSAGHPTTGQRGMLSIKHSKGVVKKPRKSTREPFADEYKKSRMIVSISPKSIAARVPITPVDELWVARGDDNDTIRAYIRHYGANGPACKKDFEYIGRVRVAQGNKMPKADLLKAVAISSGDGHAFPVVALKRRCIHCNGVLPPVGHARKNGRDHRDWPTRDEHKQCMPKRPVY